jgi:hypothetical protein
VGVFFKASALGARGLIVGMISKNFFDKLEEANKGRSGMALLVFDDKETFEKIKKSVGKKVAIKNRGMQRFVEVGIQKFVRFSNRKANKVGVNHIIIGAC